MKGQWFKERPIGRGLHASDKAHISASPLLVVRHTSSSNNGMRSHIEARADKLRHCLLCKQVISHGFYH